MNRVLFEKNEINADGTVRLAGARAKHVLEVLHGKEGQKIHVGMINGSAGDGTIVEVGKSHVLLSCSLGGQIPEAPRVDLLLALPRPKVMKRLWAQLAAIGLRRILITNAAKVERNYFDTQWLEKEYYEPLLVEGLMQSADTLMPEVRICRRFKVFVEDELESFFPAKYRFVFHPEGASALPALQRVKGERVLIAVGPEGGWTDFELDLLESHGFSSVSMGQRILRSDTACIAALALVHGVLS